MPITILSRQARANAAAEAWRQRYQTSTGNWYGSSEAGTLHARLVALGPTPDPAVVESLVGRAMYDDYCENCACTHPLGVVRIGNRPESEESRTVDVCPECLIAALRAAIRADLLP